MTPAQAFRKCFKIMTFEEQVKKLINDNRKVFDALSKA